jgi:hypothetical protein
MEQLRHVGLVTVKIVAHDYYSRHDVIAVKQCKMGHARNP